MAVAVLPLEANQ